MMHKKIRCLLRLFILLFFFLACIWAALVFLVHRNIDNRQGVIDIPAGASLRTVAKLAGNKKMIEYPFLWEVYGRLSGHSGLLHAGEYFIPANTSGKKLYQIFTSGKVIQRRVTFMAGMTVDEVLSILAEQPKMEDDLQGQCHDRLLDCLQITGEHPEGLFYPDTYFYISGAKASSVLKKSHRKLIAILDKSWQERAENLPYKTPYEALVMASLIAKETAVLHEKNQVAGVFVRRLRRGMRLQSDPTVIYGLGSDFNGNLTRQDLRKRTPYNTYRINGLPPTPISLVTKSDIEAALHPAAGSALYFVAKGDGTHIFSNTLKEQRKAITLYQLHQRSDYRSFPASTVPETKERHHE